MDKIEKNTANTILEKSVKIIVVGKTYDVAPMSIATFIEASKLIAELPWVDGNAENIFQETFRTAKHCGVLGNIVATMILGVKRRKNFLFRMLIKSIDEIRYNNLVHDLLSLTPKELNNIVSQLLKTMEINSFFGLTTSLSEVNLLKQTKEKVV